MIKTRIVKEDTKSAMLTSFSIIALLLIVNVSLAAMADDWPGLPPDCWSAGRIVHNIDKWNKLTRNFQLEKIKIENPVTFENISANKGYSFKQEGFRPNITISIYAEKDHLTLIKISDVLGVSDIKWINEKLLFIRIWWGRIAIDDIIFDVEKEAIVHTEPATDAFQAFQQYQTDCKKLGGCKCIKK